METLVLKWWLIQNSCISTSVFCPKTWSLRAASPWRGQLLYWSFFLNSEASPKQYKRLSCISIHIWCVTLNIENFLSTVSSHKSLNYHLYHLYRNQSIKTGWRFVFSFIKIAYGCQNSGPSVPSFTRNWWYFTEHCHLILPYLFSYSIINDLFFSFFNVILFFLKWVVLY